MLVSLLWDEDNVKLDDDDDDHETYINFIHLNQNRMDHGYQQQTLRLKYIYEPNVTLPLGLCYMTFIRV